MPRKRWTAQAEITSSLLKIREKRKWQIALRRYVLERNPSAAYAPFFGLDIDNFRNWIEIQFVDGLSWTNFGEKWQFDHIIPVTYFDLASDVEQKLCWNFVNIRVEMFDRNKNRGNRLDLLAARAYFEELYQKTAYQPCNGLLEKLHQIELTELISSEKQQAFIKENKTYLEMIAHYSIFEFELLNSGRNHEEVLKEIAFIKKHDH